MRRKATADIGAPRSLMKTYHPGPAAKPPAVRNVVFVARQLLREKVKDTRTPFSGSITMTIAAGVAQYLTGETYTRN
jgi:hypothetical protein